MEPLEKAIDYVGGVTRLAQLIGARQSAVSNWRARKSKIDAALCSQIERVTDGVVTRQALRPNDWHVIWPELAAKAAKPRKPFSALAE